MRIEYKSRAMQKVCTSEKEMKRRYGTVRAKLLQRRLNEIENAPNLAVLQKLPGANCHLLRADRKGQWAVSLDGAYRLVFAPDHDPLPVHDSGELNVAAITNVLVLELIDYH